MNTNFYFGRIHFKHQLTSLMDYDEDLTRTERVRQALWEYIRTDDVVFEDEEENWVFGACIEREGYLFGKFGKIYPDHPTRYDFDEGDFIEEGEVSTQADYSMFFVYPQQNLIIFNQRQHIGYRQFQRAFAGGYSNHVGIEDAVSIGLLKDAADVQEIIDQSEVSYVNFDLVPTNPTSDPDMQILDDHIQNAGADSFGVDAKADGGLNMEDDLLQAALNMSAAGYGEFEMEYEQDDRRERYKSSNKPAAQEIDRPENLDDLHTRAKDLIERARKLIGDDE
jgi:hypothetical protein